MVLYKEAKLILRHRAGTKAPALKTTTEQIGDWPYLQKLPGLRISPFRRTYKDAELTDSEVVLCIPLPQNIFIAIF